ncbi:TPA: hypothetical protein JFP82_002227 [Vibrio cholerae O1]|nr:hypothetical protein [Vibrio cholerae O1]
MSIQYKTRKDFATREHKSKERLIFGLFLICFLLGCILLTHTSYEKTILISLFICVIVFWRAQSAHDRKLDDAQVNWVKGLTASEREELLISSSVKQIEKDNLIDICRMLERDDSELNK